MTRPVILSCAITGSIHTPSMSPHLPVTPDAILTHALAAAGAGASILHLHARDPGDGRPSPDPAHYAAFVPALLGGTDAVLNITTGGGQTMTVADRLRAPAAIAPEMCSLNMGTMNFVLTPLAERPRDWRHDWERPHLTGSDDFVFRNTYRDIAGILKEMGEVRGARFEFECYDAGHIRTLAYFRDRGMVSGPLFVQFVLGILGGMDASVENLVFLKQTADRLLGPDTYEFSVAAAGRAQFPLTTVAAVMGGNVRVGLEDNLWLGPGRLAPSNAALVAHACEILDRLNLRPATPDETRARLGLKGRAAVGWAKEAP
jgi:uncharacterized protein (DUF849 family)